MDHEQFLTIPAPPVAWCEYATIREAYQDALRWLPRTWFMDGPPVADVRCHVAVPERLLEYSDRPHEIIDSVGEQVKHQLRAFLGAREARR